MHCISQDGIFSTLCGPMKGRSASIQATSTLALVTCPNCLRLIPDEADTALRLNRENAKANSPTG
jgi:hypothetical protein